MNEQVAIVLGFDPGGRGKFGWSICKIDGEQLCILRGRRSKPRKGSDRNSIGCASSQMRVFWPPGLTLRCFGATSVVDKLIKLSGKQ